MDDLLSQNRTVHVVSRFHLAKSSSMILFYLFTHQRGGPKVGGPTYLVLILLGPYPGMHEVTTVFISSSRVKVKVRVECRSSVELVFSGGGGGLVDPVLDPWTNGHGPLDDCPIPTYSSSLTRSLFLVCPLPRSLASYSVTDGARLVVRRPSRLARPVFDLLFHLSPLAKGCISLTFPKCHAFPSWSGPATGLWGVLI